MNKQSDAKWSVFILYQLITLSLMSNVFKMSATEENDFAWLCDSQFFSFQGIVWLVTAYNFCGHE